MDDAKSKNLISHIAATLGMWRRLIQANTGPELTTYTMAQVNLLDAITDDVATIAGDCWPEHLCAYCALPLDGETCHNAGCSVNRGGSA